MKHLAVPRHSTRDAELLVMRAWVLTTRSQAGSLMNPRLED